MTKKKLEHLNDQTPLIGKGTAFCVALCANKKKQVRRNWRLAATLQIRETMQNICQERMKEDVEDKWAIEVLARVNDCSDFVAAGSRYHVNCYARFSSQRDVVKVQNSKGGRKANTEMMGYFENACEWLESETVLDSVEEVRQKMNQYANGKTVYGVQYIKKLLVDRYKQHISFCSEPGRENIVYFKEMADYLINKKYRKRKQ